MSLSRATEFYKKHSRTLPIVFFVGGFVFDMLVLKRIDDLSVIVQQALYLLLLASLIAVELIEEARPFQPPRVFGKLWTYRDAFLHFLMGTLLNSFAIFYFKSASALTSFVFVTLLASLLMLNEFKRFGKAQTQVHVALLSLCMISYAACLAPTLLGFIGTIPFVLAVLASLAAFGGYYTAVDKWLPQGSSRLLKTHLLYPFAAMQILFVALYLSNAIPPVPLSVKYMGIFHGVEKVEAGWELTYTRPRWKFWENGDQTFVSRAGDVIHCYVQVFSPTRFKDQLQVRWLFQDETRGWVSSDAIPLSVVGGREEGFRAVTRKTNFVPGTWRVQVETKDGREVGRIGFTVTLDDRLEARESRKIVR